MTRTRLLGAFFVFVLLVLSNEAFATCEHDDRECQGWFEAHPPGPLELEPAWSPHMGWAAPVTDALCLSAVATYRHRIAERPAPRFTRVVAYATCEAVIEAALEMEVPPEVAVALAVQESNLDPFALGTSGEVGPVQVKPSLHCGRIGGCVEPEDYIRAGMAYLAVLLDRSRGFEYEAFAGYKCGWAGSQDSNNWPECRGYAGEVTTRVYLLRRV